MQDNFLDDLQVVEANCLFSNVKQHGHAWIQSEGSEHF